MTGEGRGIDASSRRHVRPPVLFLHPPPPFLSLVPRDILKNQCHLQSNLYPPLQRLRDRKHQLQRQILFRSQNERGMLMREGGKTSRMLVQKKGLLLFINSHSPLQKEKKRKRGEQPFFVFSFLLRKEKCRRGERGVERGKKYIMKSASSVIFLQIKSALMRAGDNSGTLISLTCLAQARKSVTSSHSQDLYLLESYTL